MEGHLTNVEIQFNIKVTQVLQFTILMDWEEHQKMPTRIKANMDVSIQVKALYISHYPVKTLKIIIEIKYLKYLFDVYKIFNISHINSFLLKKCTINKVKR